MTRIYLVQSATDLDGANGYSTGLLEGGHPWLLVAFTDYTQKHQTIFKNRGPNFKAGRRIKKRAATLNAKKEAP